MDRHGFPYTVEGNYLVLTAGLGGRRWKMAFTCGEDRVICYAAYPWQAPPERRAEVLERLNRLNAAAGFGSYFLLDRGLVVLRCDVIIADVYSIAECLESGFKHTSAGFYAHWEALGETVRTKAGDGNAV